MSQVPGEVFPTRFRSTAHGISAGAGKVGAVIAQALLGLLPSKIGLNHVMEIFAAFMVCGVATTLLIPETKRRSLEELARTYHGDEEDDEGVMENVSRGKESAATQSDQPVI